MKSKCIFSFLIAIVLSASGCANKRSLDDFSHPAACYDRDKEPFTFVVDAHMHFRPYGGEAIPLEELNSYFNRTGILFANAFGIGQMFPAGSPCVYYLDVIDTDDPEKTIDCREVPITPSVRNDFANAAEYFRNPPEGVEIALSMSFADLSKPEDIVDLIELYEREFPNTFKWAGELNLVKQAIFSNTQYDHEPTDDEHKELFEKQIDGWAAFMEMLRDRKIPLTLHADIGADIKAEIKTATAEEKREESIKYRYLMEYVLENYPGNTIIWAHMGLSKELAKMDPSYHIPIMSGLLEKYPNLYFDLSWRVLQDVYFSIPEIRKSYVDFINTYPERILAGTDFVASRNKNYFTYKEELKVTSDIYRKVDDHEYPDVSGEELTISDEAFRNIALGENYFRLMREMNPEFKYQAPEVCGTQRN